MNDLGKTVISGKIRVVSPIHIGGPQEKHLMKGLDYLVKDEKVYFLDEKKIIQKVGILNYSNSLATNELGILLRNQGINLNDVSSTVISNISGEIGTDIKTNIKDPLTGRPIIPGSSLKGSLRSVLYNYAGGNAMNNERRVFGGIGEDLFRFIIIHDIPFNFSKFFNTKTFNIRNSGREFLGGWKHHLQGQTKNQFSANGFTFPYETIDIGDIGDFSVNINKKLFDTVNQEQQRVAQFNRENPNARPKANVLKTTNNTRNFFNNSFDLFQLIQDYTKTYLEKEKAFFEKYQSDKSENILEEIKRLLNLNEKSPLLRLGLGSGFHSMTGDTLHISHMINNIRIQGNRSRGMLDNNESTKSRKIAFTGSGDDLRLYPMGFVQLMTEEFYEQHYKSEFEAKKASIIESEIKQKEKEKANMAAFESAKQKAEEEALRHAEQAELARQEALKPKMGEISFLKKAKWVDGIVVGQNGRMLKFKPFIKGFDDNVFEIAYASGMPINTIIQVMCMSPNGKMLQFQGSPKIKS